MNRETIYSGLFSKLSTISGFATKDRKLTNFSNVPAGVQPALYQLQAGEKVIRTRNKPPVYELKIELFIYAQSDDPSKAPSTTLNPLIDAVEALLAPTVQGQDVTLSISGVQHIWIEGEILIAEGVLENQAIAVIPVNILAT